eukprot:13757763-Ditylum_brightwellii.AAC.1
MIANTKTVTITTGPRKKRGLTTHIRRSVGACEGQGKQPELLFVFLRGTGCRPQETKGRRRWSQMRALFEVLCWLVSWET